MNSVGPSELSSEMIQGEMCREVLKVYTCYVKPEVIVKDNQTICAITPHKTVDLMIVGKFGKNQTTHQNIYQKVLLFSFILLPKCLLSHTTCILTWSFFSWHVISANRKKVVAGKDNMTCTGTAKKYHLCNTKVSHRLPVNFSPLSFTSLLKQTPSLWSLTAEVGTGSLSARLYVDFLKVKPGRAQNGSAFSQIFPAQIKTLFVQQTVKPSLNKRESGLF